MVSRTVEIYKALADETRLSLVHKLANIDKPTPSCDLVKSCASFLKLSQPAMSHHFGKLVDADIFIEEKHGVHKVYILNRKLLESVGINADKL